jgi:ketosteroid isomerase-like protein
MSNSGEDAGDSAVGRAKLLARQQLAIIETNALDLADANVTADFVNHRAADEPVAARGRGPDALRATVRWLRRAFSEIRFEIHDMVATEDVVYVVATMHATLPTERWLRCFRRRAAGSRRVRSIGSASPTERFANTMRCAMTWKWHAKLAGSRLPRAISLGGFSRGSGNAVRLVPTGLDDPARSPLADDGDRRITLRYCAVGVSADASLARRAVPPLGPRGARWLSPSV